VVGTLSSSSSGAFANLDSFEDYPEIGGSVCWNPDVEAHRISMVGPIRAPSQNSSNRYPTIRGSEPSDAQRPNNRVIRNLNPDFNAIRLQTIIESIQCMVPQDSPLVALARHGAEVVGQIVTAEPWARNHRGEPSIGNRSSDWVKCVFCALAPELKEVAWPDKFKPGPIDKYDDSNNPDEFIQVYHTVIEATEGDDRVKANYLPIALSGAVRSWLINLLKGKIYNWDQLCAMFI
jgi:hypothetical protein